MKTIVSVKNATKDYALGAVTVPALRGVSLDVAEGEFLSIAGPSGSGKTTLLNLIGCVDTPTSGTVEVTGKDTSKLSERALTALRLNTIGFIFQSFNLVSVLSVFQNVELPLLLQGGLSTPERRQRVNALMERVGLGEYMRHRPSELSGGQRQRVAIARALVTRPQLVLADEPTANLDSVTGENILDLIKELNRTEHTTFIFSTHDARVMAHASSVVRLADGKFFDRLTPAEAAAAGVTRTVPTPERPEMAGTSARLGVIAKIAVRNLFASRLKTVIVGGIILFGALLVVVGTSFLNSIVTGMRRSVVGSVAGHIQVYSSKSKDPLEVMGSFNLEGADLGTLDDYAKVRETIEKIPHVKAVVPMGINGAIVTSGNTIDLALGKLRDLARKKVAKRASEADIQAYQSEKGHVRQMIGVLQTDIKNIRQLQNESALKPEEAAAVARAASEEFWRGFDGDPMESLEFLENQIAPLATDADMLFLRYVGTDPAVFEKSFDRMKIVDGTSIPRGKRGFMFAKFTYEEQLKLKTARRLDKIKAAREDRGATIAKDAELQRFVKENSTQVRELLLQLDAPKTALFRDKLQKKLGSQEGDVGKLLASFFQMDDASFNDRYKFFYDELAPSLELYRVRVGDTLTIKAFTRSGYVQSVSLPVYGTFNFSGLEKSPQAGQLNLMDMVSFRELYGFLTADRAKEIAAIKAENQASLRVKDVSRENAEAELFGAAAVAEAEAPKPAAATKTEVRQTGKAGKAGKAAAAPPVVEAPAPRTVVAEATPGVHPPEFDGVAGKLAREDLVKRVYDPAQLESGVVLNAAVILDDERYIKDTMKAIEDAGKAAGLPLKTITWQEASGFIGQLVFTFSAVLYIAVLIIFVVALAIINNALVMATLQRVQEIGTLRALGAQRRFILAMLILEALVVGIVFGTLGAGLGAVIVSVIGKVGIPAPNDISYFFFSGPRLHPLMATGNLIGALVIVFVVSALSSLYPAWLAMRVSPRQAMQSEES